MPLRSLQIDKGKKHSLYEYCMHENIRPRFILAHLIILPCCQRTKFRLGDSNVLNYFSFLKSTVSMRILDVFLK